MLYKRLLFVLSTVLLFGVVFAIPLTAQDTAEETDGELLTIYEAYLNAWVYDQDALPEYLAEDIERHHLRGPNIANGELVEELSIEEIAEGAAGFHEAFPGVEFVVEYSVERDDYIWSAISTTEIPDTDGMVFHFILMAHFTDDKISEIWVADDELAMLSLLDAMPMMEE